MHFLQTASLFCCVFGGVDGTIQTSDKLGLLELCFSWNLATEVKQGCGREGAFWELNLSHWRLEIDSKQTTNFNKGEQ